MRGGDLSKQMLNDDDEMMEILEDDMLGDVSVEQSLDRTIATKEQVECKF